MAQRATSIVKLGVASSRSLLLLVTSPEQANRCRPIWRIHPVAAAISFLAYVRITGTLFVSVLPELNRVLVANISQTNLFTFVYFNLSNGLSYWLALAITPHMLRVNVGQERFPAQQKSNSSETMPASLVVESNGLCISTFKFVTTAILAVSIMAAIHIEHMSVL